MNTIDKRRPGGVAANQTIGRSAPGGVAANRVNRLPARDGIYLGIGVVLFAAIIGWQTAQIPVQATYAQVGPTVIPWIVAALLALLGGAIIAQSWFGYWTVAPSPGGMNVTALAWVGLGLFLNVVVISYLGFILASTALFVCIARAFESKNPLRDTAIGFSIAFLCYLGFDRLLGYRIGNGLIENLI